ncbi:MAG: hypothetical protein ACI8X5_004093 [Planctomycetota bacterium]|jgi:hypothetical protein
MTRRRGPTVNFHEPLVDRQKPNTFKFLPITSVENISVIRPNGTISPEQARKLLRSFRDLNLGPCGIEVGDNERVTVAGCLSLDHPVELGVRYSLREDDGIERVLGIQWSAGHLTIQLTAGSAYDSALDQEFEVKLGCDGLGRISAPDLGARLNLTSSEAKDIEHFLRRIVRAAYSRVS